MSTFRANTQYNFLLRRFDVAMENVWPECFTGSDCTFVPAGVTPQECKDLEELVLSSYKMMKYIRRYLKKKKLGFDEGNKVPTMYKALELAAYASTSQTGSLAIEADAMEAVSRAGYRWLETHFLIQPKKKNKIKKWCQVCKTKLANDDSDMLCDYCSGQVDDEGRRVNAQPVGLKRPAATSDMLMDPQDYMGIGGSDMMLPPTRVNTVNRYGKPIDAQTKLPRD